MDGRDEGGKNVFAGRRSFGAQHCTLNGWTKVLYLSPILYMKTFLTEVFM